MPYVGFAEFETRDLTNLPGQVRNWPASTPLGLEGAYVFVRWTVAPRADMMVSGQYHGPLRGNNVRRVYYFEPAVNSPEEFDSIENIEAAELEYLKQHYPLQ